MKNDDQRDYIKEAFDKLYGCVMPYIDLTQFADARTAFRELDQKVHSEIYILKKCLAESDRAVEAGLTRSKVLQERIHELEGENASLRATTFDTIDEKEKEINDLRKENNRLRVTPADANAIEVLKRENRVLRCDNKKLAAACEENNRLRGVIDNLEKEINTLKKKIHELEQETADDTIRIKSLERANSVLRGDNKILWSKLEEVDIPKHPKRIWHADGNDMTGAWTCCENLAKAIEFQNKKIEELEAEKARLKEAYDIHETTTKKENVDLSPGHEFEFGDEVFVPWSDEPYMYVKTGLLYNTRTKRLVYVGTGQHLKWFGEKFAIV